MQRADDTGLLNEPPEPLLSKNAQRSKQGRAVRTMIGKRARVRNHIRAFALRRASLNLARRVARS